MKTNKALTTNGSFTLTPVGLEVKRNISFEEWLDFGQTLRKMHKGVQFWLGDWINFGENKFGEKYSQALEETDYEYQTLRNAAWVSGHVDVSLRRDELTYSHHKEVAGLEPSMQKALLDEAVKNDYSVRRLREKRMELLEIKPKKRVVTCPNCGHEITL